MDITDKDMISFLRRLSVKDAERFGLKQETLHRWIERRELPKLSQLPTDMLPLLVNDLLKRHWLASWWESRSHARILAKHFREQRNASYWIHFFYRDQNKADAVLGDLDELLHERLKEYGKKKALRWYREQVALLLINLLLPLLRRILGSRRVFFPVSRASLLASDQEAAQGSAQHIWPGGRIPI